jgi:hypothetical protein
MKTTRTIDDCKARCTELNDRCKAAGGTIRWMAQEVLGHPGLVRLRVLNIAETRSNPVFLDERRSINEAHFWLGLQAPWLWDGDEDGRD